MQIVIDIDEDYYRIIKLDVEFGHDYIPLKLIAKTAHHFQKDMES